MLLTPRETGGKFGAFASGAGPGDGPPRHRHPKSDEVFVILQGRLRFWCAGEASERTAGELFYIPAGVEHTFVVVERARWIARSVPGWSRKLFPDGCRTGVGDSARSRRSQSDRGPIRYGDYRATLSRRWTIGAELNTIRSGSRSICPSNQAQRRVGGTLLSASERS
ncbi:cupin domain-containing protein [Mesorhizobium sp. LjNodule214]|uniref:cupin domain-containing protein n=1 Tax=Mesorhizobium sp. LjNodule214 TaxID=3342252 RepID=UPI003F4FE94B